MIITVFSLVKENVTAADAADFYGIEKKGKMYKCPFHSDSNPSMQADKRFYCYACGESGDAVDFVSELFGLGLKEAAEKIVSDFGLDAGNYNYKARDRPVKKEKSLRESKLETIQKLIEYEKILNELKTIFAPEPDGEKMSQAFLITTGKLRETDELLYRFYQNPTEDEIKKLIELSKNTMEE